MGLLHDTYSAGELAHRALDASDLVGKGGAAIGFELSGNIAEFCELGVLGAKAFGE
jgi:hypothetical protein